MDRWKAEQGRDREKRKIRRKKSRRERVRRKQMPMREKVGKSRNTVFPMIWGSGGSKSRLAKAAGAEPAGQMRDEKLHSVDVQNTILGPLLEVAMSKKCTPLWREAHFEVKMHKHTILGPLLEVEMWKSARRCGAKHISKSKCTKHTSSGPLLAVEMWKSARRCGAKHISKSKCTIHHMFAPLLEVQMPFCVAGARDCAPLQKWAKREGFVAFPKTIASMGHFEEDLQRCIFRGRRSTRDMFMRDVKRSGRWFLERGCILQYQMCRFAKMILRDRCSTSYDLASIFPGRRSTLDRWTGKIAKRIGTRLSALHSTFHFWRRLTEFFVFDVLHFEKWGSLAELLRFGCCQVQKMKTSRRIVPFWTFLCSNMTEVSQNFFVFDFADR